MPVWAFMKLYLKIFLTLASPFIILSLARQIIPINQVLIVYGFCFSIIMSLLLAFNLREVRFTINFRDREQYLKALTEILSDLGYTLKSAQGMFITYERHSYLVSGEIHVFLFKDSALIIAPNKYKPILQRCSKSGLLLLLDYFA